MAPLGAIFGGPVAGWIADALGRKMVLLLVIIPYLSSYLIITYAYYSGTAIGLERCSFLDDFSQELAWVGPV